MLDTSKGIPLPVPQIPLPPEAKKEVWPTLIERAKYWMDKDGVDDGLHGFERLFCKIAANELQGKGAASPQGVAIIGPPGCGKSFRLAFMARHLNVKMISAAELVERLSNCYGIAYFHELTRTDEHEGEIVPKRYYHLIIDDLGAEIPQVVRYGTRKDIMADVLMARYLYFPRHLTHFSTNLDEGQLLARYGARIFSRLCEMCLFVHMDGEDRRRKQ